MLKWCEIGPTKTHRYDFFSQFLTTNGIENQFTFIEANKENLREKIEEAKATKQFIRFHPKLFDQVSLSIENNLRELEILKSVDTLFYDERQGYWPESLFRESFFEYLTHVIKNLDIMQKALVIGTCGIARASISALIRLGFSQINITSYDDKSAESLIKDLSEIYYNVHFEYTNQSDITILPGTHGLVLNTLSVLEDEEFPIAIYFFNFLKKNGLVIDLSEIPVETPFLKIALDIEARAIYGYEALGFFDLNWVFKATGQKLDFESYKGFLKPKLESVTYNKAKIQKIIDEFQI